MLVGVDGYFQVFKLCSRLEKKSMRNLKGLPQEYAIMEQGKGRNQERGLKGLKIALIPSVI